MRKRNRIYWRARGGRERAYGDFRDYRDVAGSREALIPKGAKLATEDPVVAEVLAVERVSELESMRRNRTLVGASGARLGPYAAYHLKAKAEAGRTTDRYLANVERYLRQAVDYFGEDRALDSIGVRDIEAWMAHLEAQPNRRGETLSSATRRHHLNAVSNVYRRAIGEGVVPAGYNPAAGVMEKPQGRRFEAAWLEVPEAALLIEAARTYRMNRNLKNGAPSPEPVPIYPILATFLLTGGRKSEVLGLELDDVSFDRKTITFRPNDHRGLKTRTSHRTVPLWPQLEEILRPYVFDPDEPREDGLLFPSPRGDGMIRDVRKVLATVAKRAGWKANELHLHGLRHTYAAARLQTLDRGAPVSPYTVAKELGHGGDELVKRIYGHLGEIRHRSEFVECRVEQHKDVLGARLEVLYG
jgi:integrase